VNRRSTTLRRALAVPALASAVAGAAGCFYTDPINTRPDVRIEKLGSEPVLRGGEVPLVAYLDDPDGDVLDLDWFVRACSADEVCDEVPIESLGSGEGEEAIQALVPAFVRDGTAVVELRANVVATDRFGAEATDVLPLEVGNQAPLLPVISAIGAVRGPFGGWRIDTPINLTATVSDPEGDPVELFWDHEPPRGVLSGDYSFQPVIGEPDQRELVASVPGDWIIALTVMDGLEASVSAAPRVVTVDPDAAPCLVSVEPLLPPDGVQLPLVDDGDVDATRFRVLQVADDLDPYPVPANGDNQLEPTTFRWSLASPASGGVFVPVGGDLATFDLDHRLFEPGDELALRVEVDDRRERALPCPADQPTCSLGDDRDITGDFVEDVCLQRQTWQLVVGQALP
jgi:hypothetical protein